jgi:DNA-binding NarL/FixJ family response regulator
MVEIKILVVEDDTFTRTTLCNALRLHRLTVVGEAPSPSIAMGMVNKLSPDVVLIDLDLGKGPTGIDLAHAIRSAKPNTGIVFLTSYDDPRFHRPNLPALPPGSEYLVKRSVSDIEQITKAIIRAVNAGDILQKKPRIRSSSIGVQFSELSDIQVETIRLVSLGMTNAEIAKTRFITEKSVEQTINRVAKILNLAKDSSQNQRVHIARTFFRMSDSHPTE